MEHFNQLTPAEVERLALVLEEMGEASQIIGKILRHGYESYNPTIPDSPTNREMLLKELADVACAINFMIANKDIDNDDFVIARVAKYGRMGRYLHHNRID